MTEIEKAWLAAALDGEGSIELRSYPKGKLAANPQIVIYNTNMCFLKRVLEIVGDGKIVEKKRLRKSRYQPLAWRLSGLQKCSLILKQIYPYLIIKADKAKQLILFAEFRLKRKGRFGPYEKAILRGDINEIEEIRRLL